tara:strand:- start:68 stop:403 length:336 start_codon:yes stop_codon:yes gene_type:complete
MLVGTLEEDDCVDEVDERKDADLAHDESPVDGGSDECPEKTSESTGVVETGVVQVDIEARVVDRDVGAEVEEGGGGAKEAGEETREAGEETREAGEETREAGEETREAGCG